MPLTAPDYELLFRDRQGYIMTVVHGTIRQDEVAYRQEQRAKARAAAKAGGRNPWA